MESIITIIIFVIILLFWIHLHNKNNKDESEMAAQQNRVAEAAKIETARLANTNQWLRLRRPFVNDPQFLLPADLPHFACTRCGGLANVEDAMRGRLQRAQLSGLSLDAWDSMSAGRAIVQADFQRHGMSYEAATAAIEIAIKLGFINAKDRKVLLSPCLACSNDLEENLRPVTQTEAPVADFPTGVMTWIDHLSGPDFERLVIHILESDGWTVEHIGGSGDRGVDILAKDLSAVQWGIQAKRHKAAPPYSALQEVFTGARLHGAQRAAVVSNNDFSRQSVRDAQSLNVELWGRNWLIEGLLRLAARGLVTPS